MLGMCRWPQLNFYLECKHKTAFRARKVTGTFEKQATGLTKEWSWKRLFSGQFKFSSTQLMLHWSNVITPYCKSVFRILKGFKTWVIGVFWAYEWLAMPLARRPRQNEFFSPKENLEIFSCLNVSLWSSDISRDQKLKMKEISELVANLLCFNKQIGISERG